MHAATRLAPALTCHAQAKSADAFIALPGGYGTLEELLEVTTWQQLGYSAKPVGLLNIAGYYDKLLQFFDHAHSEGFVSAKGRGIVVTANTPEALLDALERYVPPPSLIALKAAAAGAPAPVNADANAFL